jgi:DNA-binding MarR family transcriptional regulator
MTKLTTEKAAARKPAVPNSAATKLTDAQRTFLSLAAQREDGAGALPEGMTDKAAKKLVAALVEKGLVREVRAKAGAPICRSDENGRPFALIITKLGRVAVAAQDDRQPASTASNAPALSSSDASLSQDLAPSQSERSTPRQGAKLAAVILLLSGKQGARIEELTSATGWLPHTTRAALTGLRKRGYMIERARSEQGGSLYRIVASPAPALAA